MRSAHDQPGRLWSCAQETLGLSLGRGTGVRLTKGNGPDGFPFFIQRSLAEAAVVFGQPAQGLGGKPGAQVLLSLPEHGEFRNLRVERRAGRGCALNHRRTSCFRQSHLVAGHFATAYLGRQRFGARLFHRSRSFGRNHRPGYRRRRARRAAWDCAAWDDAAGGAVCSFQAHRETEPPPTTTTASAATVTLVARVMAIAPPAAVDTADAAPTVATRRRTACLMRARSARVGASAPRPLPTMIARRVRGRSWLPPEFVRPKAQQGFFEFFPGRAQTRRVRVHVRLDDLRDVRRGHMFDFRQNKNLTLSLIQLGQRTVENPQASTRSSVAQDHVRRRCQGLDLGSILRSRITGFALVGAPVVPHHMHRET